MWDKVILLPLLLAENPSANEKSPPWFNVFHLSSRVVKFVRSTFPGRQAALWQNWSHIVVLRTIITADLGRVALDVLSGGGRPRPSADTPATLTPHSEVTALKNKRSEDVKRRREGRTGRLTMFAGVGVIVERLSS